MGLPRHGYLKPRVPCCPDAPPRQLGPRADRAVRPYVRHAWRRLFTGCSLVPRGSPFQRASASQPDLALASGVAAMACQVFRTSHVRIGEGTEAFTSPAPPQGVRPYVREGGPGRRRRFTIFTPSNHPMVTSPAAREMAGSLG